MHPELHQRSWRHTSLLPPLWVLLSLQQQQAAALGYLGEPRSCCGRDIPSFRAQAPLLQRPIVRVLSDGKAAPWVAGREKRRLLLLLLMLPPVLRSPLREEGKAQVSSACEGVGSWHC